VLFAERGGERALQLTERFPRFLEAIVRRPFHDDGMWLVRPDGYVALATKEGRWEEVAEYLKLIAG
jgi:hypothetical protein